MQPSQLVTTAIIPAAGSGRRMGNAPKALLGIADCTIIERCIAGIAAGKMVSRMLISIREQDRASFEALELGKRFPDGEVILVRGGEMRQISVFNALSYLQREAKTPADSLILVHDAARCLVSGDLVRRCIEGACRWDAVTAAIPLVDSIKRAGADLQVEESPARENIWCVQTPQVFRFGLLYQAHVHEIEQGRPASATDDSSLVEKFHAVRIVEGERLNFKITSQEDLQLARCLLEHQCRV